MSAKKKRNRAANRRVTVTVKIKQFIRVTIHKGEFHGGACLLCDSIGWLDDAPFGLPYESSVLGNKLRHSKKCPLNDHLNQDGTLK